MMNSPQAENAGQRVIRLQQEYWASPEVAILARIKHLDITLEIFRGNAKELRRVIVYHMDPARMLDLWALRNRSRLQALQREVTRLLHNFLAAAMTLVDHTRKLHQKHYETGSGLPGYESEKATRFVDNTLHHFIQDLRNCMLHVEVPVITSELRATSGSSSSHLLLTRDVLERFEGWNQKARQHLDASDWKIDLADSCGDYTDNVEAFHRWFRQQLAEHHRAELDVVRALSDALRAAQRAAGVDDV